MKLENGFIFSFQIWGKVEGSDLRWENVLIFWFRLNRLG